MNLFRFFLNGRPCACLALGLASATLLQAQPYGLESRPAMGSFLNEVMPETAPVASSALSVTPAFPNLYFTNLLGVLPVPGTNLLCAWEREGRVWMFANDSNTTQKTLVLDISSQCQGWDDSGLLSLAFHPGYATNNYIYLYYTWVTPGTVIGNPTNRPPEQVLGKYHDRLSRFTVANGVSSTNSELVLVDQTGDSVWHNGGSVIFNPTNGFLYWTDGDDKRFATQIITNKLFSGVFRIDVDMRGSNISHPIPRQPNSGTTGHYYIPNDNPFVGQSNALEEFFCLGLRNPYRMTIDPPSGRIFIGDVGEDTREEVDIIEAGESGLNFQWNVIEGLNGDLPAPYVGINRRPVIDYLHTEGQAVIGGYVYRGSEFAAELGHSYIFGDNVARTIWKLNEGTNPVTKTAIALLPKGDGPNSGSDYTGLSSFGLNTNNELFICQMSSVGGRIFKFAPGAPTASRPLPTLLSETGVFTNLATLAPNPGLVPYTVNSPLWSDNAVKSRWMSLATNTAVSFATNGEWTFPNGTVFVKQFDLPVNDTDPSIVKRLETRLLVIGTNGLIYGASYKWRADYSDADLVPTLTNENILVTTATGTRTQVWTYPGRQECLTCHTIPSGGVLGVKTRQLNGDFNYPATGVTDNQLRTWNHLGLFNTNLNEADIPHFAKLVPVTDTNSPDELRVRSFLDSNCAQCHRPGGGVQANFDARFDTPLEDQGLVGGAVQNPLGLSGAFVVAPGNTNKSILFLRDNSVSSVGMPPLAKNLVYTNVMVVLARWIASLPQVTDPPPVPWQHADIGNVVLPGNATYGYGQFTDSGAGDDIWNNADAFHFIYQPLNGDGSITARVLLIQPTDSWAKAGVMFRETLASNSVHAFMLISAFSGSVFEFRSATGGISYNLGGNGAAPYWVRLVRSGNTFTGFISSDESTWVEIGATTIKMNSQVEVGLAVSSHNTSMLNNSVFDNVTVVSAASMPPAVSLTAPANGNSYVYPTNLLLSASATAANGVITNVAFFRDVAKLGDIAAAPYNLTWTNAALGSFAFRAIASDSSGISATSAPVNASVQTVLGTNVYSVKINFQTNGVSLFPGYLADCGLAFGDRANGYSYGWDVDNSAFVALRNSPNSFDARYDSFNAMQMSGGGHVWEIAIPNGTYQVRIVAGDPDFSNGHYHINAENVSVLDGVPTAALPWIEGFATVNVNDGRLTLTSGADATNNKIDFIEISTALTNVPAINLLSATRTNGAFQFALQGLNGVHYVIEASTNLQNWMPVLTNTPVSNLLEYIETGDTNWPARYYRGRLP